MYIKQINVAASEKDIRKIVDYGHLGVESCITTGIFPYQLTVNLPLK